VTRSSGVSFWIAIIALLGLYTLGSSDDTASSLRDANIEIKMLAQGATNEFVEFCKGSLQKEFLQEEIDLEKRFKTSFDTAPRRIRYSPDFKIGLLYSCPFPTQEMSVEDALNMVLEPTPFALIKPHGNMAYFLARQGAKPLPLYERPPLGPSASKKDRVLDVLTDVAQEVTDSPSDVRLTQIATVAFASAEEASEPYVSLPCAWRDVMLSELNAQTVTLIRFMIVTHSYRCMECHGAVRQNRLSHRRLLIIFTIIGLSLPN
jgi:hypothetical protein